MFYKTNLCIFALFELVTADSKPIKLSLHPDEIMKSFKSIVSSDYIKVLANDFATKAAEHFIQDMKTKERKIEKAYNTRLRWREMLDKAKKGIQNQRKPQDQELNGFIDETMRLKSKKEQENWNQQNSQTTPDLNVKYQETLVSPDTDKPPVLNEAQAIQLLHDPSPDGDNLGEQLTDAEGEADTKAIPVIGVMKINGVYYRRLLGMI